MSLIYSCARLTITFVWCWHGLVPKLLFRNADEALMLQAAGFDRQSIPLMLTVLGALEILIALLGVVFWRWRGFLTLTAVAMLAALAGVAFKSPQYLRAAFNPVSLNACMLTLSLIAWLSWRYTAFAGRCLRKPRKTP